MRLRTTVAGLAVLVLATPAAAGPRKPMSGAYDVAIPVPYPMESAAAHCDSGYDDLTRATRDLALPATGELKAEVTGFVGDWVVELYDAKGRVLATGAVLDLTSGARSLRWRKKKAGAEVVTLAVCNFGGTPSGHVKWTYAFSR